MAALPQTVTYDEANGYFLSVSLSDKNKYPTQESSLSTASSEDESSEAVLTPKNAAQPNSDGYDVRGLTEALKQSALENIMGEYYRIFHFTFSFNQRTGSSTPTSQQLSGGSSSSRQSMSMNVSKSKRPIAEQNPSDQEDEENTPRRKRPRDGSASASNQQSVRRLACPFFKRDPHKYETEQACTGPGWLIVHRIK